MDYNKIRTISVDRQTGAAFYNGQALPEGAVDHKDGNWRRFSENSRFIYYERVPQMSKFAA